MGVVVKAAFRVHAPPPCEDEVAIVGGLLQVCDYAKDAELSGGNGDIAIREGQGKDGVVGDCVREGHVFCGWGCEGWRPTNSHWRRQLPKPKSNGETRVGALALSSVTQWCTVPVPLEPQCCQVTTRPRTQGGW